MMTCVRRTAVVLAAAAVAALCATSQRAVLAQAAAEGAPGAKKTLDAAPAAALRANEQYAQWKNGPSSSADFFPIAVWMQPASRARDYKAAGVNIYCNQWKGPTEEHLKLLREADMPLMCHMNDVALKHMNDRLIIAWLQHDEPDIAHSHLWDDLKNRETPSETFGAYRPPYHPSEVVERYRFIKAVDPTRPVFVSLSLAVVYGDAAARGNRKNHPEDYPAYMEGLDIVAFDIYPGVHQHKPAAGKYWTVAKGVRNLVQWAGGKKPVWVDIEAMKPRLDHSPHTYKAEVWMGIIHGATGINYYVHQNASGRGPVPSIEDSVFEDKEMLATFTATNKLMTRLAPVLNSPTIEGGVDVASSVPAGEEMAAAGLDPIAAMVKRHDGATWLLTVRMEPSAAKGTFTLKGLPAKCTAEVIGEDRTLDVAAGRFSDDYGPMDVHLYRIAPAK